MFINIKSSARIEQLANHLQHYTEALLQNFDMNSPAITLESVDNLAELFDKDKIFIVQDGMIHLTNNGQILCSFDEGDLIGLTPAFGMPFPVLRTDEYVELIPIDRDRFLKHIYSDPKRVHAWSHYLICVNAILANQLAEQSQALMKPTAGFQNFQAGDVMIQQGDSAELVYTIIEGEADVFVDDVKVGDIGQDEVFGAMSVFTGEPRSATVIARTACTIMAVPKKDFTLLIEAQPKAAVNLIESLSHKIVQLNQLLIGKCK